MGFRYEERPSASGFVDVLWRTVDETDGTYLAAADACWDLIVTRTADDATRVLLSGPSSRPTLVPYRRGSRNLGARFVRGAFFTHVDPHELCDRTVPLEIEADGTRFVLAGRRWPVPRPEHPTGLDQLDDLLDAFGRTGLVAHDTVVEAVMRGASVGVSARSVQRHFAKATGLTPGRVRRIERARAAAERLRGGEPIATVAVELGYADQSHLTRDVGELTGYTPVATRRRDEPV